MEKIETVKKVAANISAEAARKGLKTKDLADIWEITPESVRYKLKGDRSTTYDELAILARRLDIPVAKFMEGVDLSPISTT